MKLGGIALSFTKNYSLHLV